MRNRFILIITLLSVIASCTKKSAPVAEKKVDVAGLFSKNCAKCHGTDGMSGRAPNLGKTDLDKAGLVKMISQGEGHMPAFADVLSASEIDAISKWILSIKS